MDSKTNKFNLVILGFLKQMNEAVVDYEIKEISKN